MHSVNLNSPPGVDQHHPGLNVAGIDIVGNGVGSILLQSPVNINKQSPNGSNLHRGRSSPASPLGARAPPSRVGGQAASGQAGRPHVLSSSGTSTYNLKRLNRNIGQRKHAHTGHKLMADVTAEAGEKMVKTLQDMIDANKELESMRLEMQSKMHAEQMEYRRERDRQEMENMRLTLLN